MSLQMIHFTARQEHIADLENGIAEAFSEVNAAKPTGLRYLAIRRDGTDEFLLLLHLADGATNPLLSLPAAAALREQMPNWVLTSPAPATATVIGDYRLFA